jgi:hypothetical protein
MLVKLTSAICGHRFDKEGRFTGVFANAVGDEIEMDDVHARRCIEAGLANEVKKSNK